VFILKHQDGDIQYIFEKGGYAVVESKLYLSIETKASNDDAFPDGFLFAVDGFPLNGELENINFEISTNYEDEPPNVHVYTTFHASEVEARVELKLLSESEIEVSVNVISEDVNYGGEKAIPNPFVGTAKLTKKRISEMLIPS